MKRIHHLYSNFQGLGEKNGALYPVVDGLDHMKVHYVQRRKEIEDLVSILELRVQAEQEYSNKLFNISDRNQLDSIRIGLLSKEVDSFKANCRQKARASLELAENVSQDCVRPLKDLIAK